MGRFDGLKGNTFSEKSEKNQERGQKRYPRKTKVKEVKSDRFNFDKKEEEKPKIKEEKSKPKIKEEKSKPKIKEEKSKPKIKEEKPKEEKPKEEKPKIESEWIKKVKITEKRVEANVNVNDPKYWDGPIWKGPVFLKGEKMNEKYKKYIEDASKLCSSIIIPNSKTQWSRDGLHWYNSYDETFSEEHLQAIKDYEWNREMDKFAVRTMELYEKRREESERNYWEYGEIDSFKWAEIEHEKYEKYCEKLEKEWEEADKLAAEEEKQDDEEYLEDDN